MEKFGKYSLLHKLATGGMGEVWLARQSGPAGFDRFIAVKRLLPNLAENNEFVQMFLDEARLAARLTHPNICQVYEFGREGGSYYLAMEYMHGESLSSMLERSIKERKPLSLPVVAYIIAQALEGLHFAHEAKDEHGRPLGLVHRDISPSNIFVTYDGQVKLLDFGIAKAAHRITQTVAGSIKGKFGYIAPEVYKGHNIDRRVDLFAMGVVLWEMLTRRRLYKRAAEYEILRAIVEEPPPDPRGVDSNVAPELAQSALKSLAKEPSERYQTALEMRRAISLYLRGLRDEMDAQEMAQVMVALYGQVWIDLRASVLESFKDASGAVANADALNATRTNSQVAAIVEGKEEIKDFSQQVQAPPPVRTPGSRAPEDNLTRSSPGRPGSRPGAVLNPPSAFSPDPTAIARSRPRHAAFWVGIGSAVTVVLAIGWAAFAAIHTKGPSNIDEATATREDPSARPIVPIPTPGLSAQTEAALAAAAASRAASAGARVVVTTNAKGAMVQLDDGDERPAPSTFDNLTPGTKHHFVVHANGYEPLSREFEAKAGESNFDVPLAHKHVPVARQPPPVKHAPSTASTRVINPDQPIDVPWGAH